MKKLVLFVITSLLFTFLYLSVQNTYSLFTKKIDKTGSINTIKSEATFLPGHVFNVKIKTLSGDENPELDTANTTIINIVRSNKLTINPTSDNIISDSNSIMPIYAWFSNGTLYYYSEANEIYFNSNSNSNFRNLKALENINISTLNTSRVNSFWAMFYETSKIEELDLSNFNTSIMFYFFPFFILFNKTYYINRYPSKCKN